MTKQEEENKDNNTDSYIEKITKNTLITTYKFKQKKNKSK